MNYYFLKHSVGVFVMLLLRFMPKTIMLSTIYLQVYHILAFTEFIAGLSTYKDILEPQIEI